jgi:alkylation response protein AidB-like acyl-CoA dehydrogenase
VPDGADFEAIRSGARYRLKGNKMWISAGEHELAENIIHLVLAKIPGPDGKLIPARAASRCSSCPRRWSTEGQLTGERNDVALAGLNHKLGWRGTTNTLLNFGEGKYPVRGGAGAIGYLVGKPHEGPALHVPHDERGAHRHRPGATALGLAGYYASLDYAKNRPQGRPSGRPARTRPAAGAHHRARRRQAHAAGAEVLLRRRAGADAVLRAPGRRAAHRHAGSADEARLLLEVLTPIAKSWPSEFCLEANSLAIQVHGGYGYTRDFPVEQYWRDNRLNMIHEGTHGIQAADLLGRKVVMEGGKGLQLLAGRINATIERAIQQPDLAEHANALGQALQKVGAATKAAWATGNPAMRWPMPCPTCRPSATW